MSQEKHTAATSIEVALLTERLRRYERVIEALGFSEQFRLAYVAAFGVGGWNQAYEEQCPRP